MDSDSSDSDNELFQRRQRTFKEIININITDFKERFRLTENQSEQLVIRIANHLIHPTRRNHALSPRQQLLVALRFLATGGFYHLIGDAHGPSKSTVCRAVKRVVTAINTVLFDELVRWPNSEHALSAIPIKFREYGGMVSVGGCVDGTLLEIKAPTVNEDQFVDRHGQHSLNCMVVCGPNLEAYYVSARWPGRLNDRRVIKNSVLFDAFEAGWRPFPNAVLLADSGYSLKEWLIPPIGGHNLSDEENQFNIFHKRTRSVIERFFGVVKQRFACLTRPLRVAPDYAGEIFKVCCVLQNFIVSSEEDDFIAKDNLELPAHHGTDDIDAINGPNLRDPTDPRHRIIRLMRL